MERTLKDIFYENHDIYFSDEVNESSLLALIKDINAIVKKDEQIIAENRHRLEALNITGAEFKKPEINIYISTYGGVVYDGLGMYDAIKALTKDYKVNVIITGKAMSCGLFIIQAGSMRYGTKNSTYLYHDLGCFGLGKIKEIQEDTEESIRLRNRVHDILLSRTKLTEEQLNDVIEHKKDWYFDAETALKLGVIDEIID
jgi:ATP-dependent Clp protease protease subunit